MEGNGFDFYLSNSNSDGEFKEYEPKTISFIIMLSLMTCKDMKMVDCI